MRRKRKHFQNKMGTMNEFHCTCLFKTVNINVLISFCENFYTLIYAWLCLIAFNSNKIVELLLVFIEAEPNAFPFLSLRYFVAASTLSNWIVLSLNLFHEKNNNKNKIEKKKKTLHAQQVKYIYVFKCHFDKHHEREKWHLWCAKRICFWLKLTKVVHLLPDMG